MRHIIATVLVALTTTGCPLLETRPATPQETMEQCLKKESKTVCEMRAYLIEGYTTLVSLNTEISANAKAKVWSKSQAQEYLDASKDARQVLDRIDTLLALGDITTATQQRELARNLITDLQRRVAAQARR